jgi:penicillin-binding protein 1A
MLDCPLRLAGCAGACAPLFAALQRGYGRQPGTASHSDMTDDFDFDFDVDRGRSAAGTDAREEAEETRTRVDDPPERENGAGLPELDFSLEEPEELDDSGGPGGNGSPRIRPRENGSRGDRERSPARPTADDGGDDWLELADNGVVDRELGSLASPDDGPAGPPTPLEGRTFAKAARQRAARRSSTFGTDDGADFETILQRQPQKSGVAKRSSALLHGFRELGDGLRERAREGRERLRDGRGRIDALRERVPEIRRPAVPGDGKPPPPKLPTRIRSGRPRRPQPGRVKKLRLLVIIAGLGVLALVSMVFGMMMAVAGNLPQLETKAQYAEAKNSEVYDSEGRKIGTLLSNNQRILVDSDQISPYMKQAAVAIEDERFYEHRGVDYLGIGRAALADVMPGGSTQGASTITMQFVKNALEAQGSRTYFQKLREAAYAYHLERKWDKDKILTEYLNTIYFGEGAYGIEAAARTYFSYNHIGCGQAGADTCASELTAPEAAMLAGMISSPSAYSPRVNPETATERRNLVLAKMKEQGVLDETEYEDGLDDGVPAPSQIEKPEDDSLSPYFTSWLRQQVVDRYGAGKAFGGGLDVHTTIDLDMQEEAESIAYNTLAGIEPTASVVVLENETGAVKALVGGNDFEKEPFNLATNGARQPGSSMKPFVLAAYLNEGGSPSDVYTSGPQEFVVPHSGGKEIFRVENYEDNYLGSASVADATKYSDNSVFAQMGLREGSPLADGRKGPKRVAELAEEMGIQTEVDQIPAIMLGAPSVGFTPLEFTYAFNAIAEGGERVGGTLDACPGNKSTEEFCPVGITKIVGPDGDVEEKNEVKTKRVLGEDVAETTKDLLHGPVSSGGTGQAAQTPGDEWGKTGTTENHGDAWFCGGTDHLTACVWVGHAQNNTPMETEFGGSPVAGGTYPATIWGSIMSALESIYEERLAAREAEEEEDEEEDEGDSSGGDEGSDYSGDSVGDSSGGGSGSYSGGGGSGGGSGGGAGGGGGPAQPAPSGGGGGGGAVGGGAPSGTGGTGL